MAGEGRKSVKGKRRKPKQFKNDGHSFKLKLAVLKTSDTATMKETIEKFFPALPATKRQTKRHNIERWRHQRAKTERMAAKQRMKGNQPLDSARKASYKAHSPQLEVALVTWNDQYERWKFPIVTGAAIRQKAEKIHCEFMQDPITSASVTLAKLEFSKGRLFKFQARHGLKSRRAHGKAGSVNSAAVDEGRARLQIATFDYDRRDIYNIDETAYFYCVSPDKSVTKSSIPGCKSIKKRMTVAVTSNADGSAKTPLLFIGTDRRTYCFGNKTGEGLGLDYANAPKEWMNSDIFGHWIERFNETVRVEGRHVLLLLDNISSHQVNAPLSNVTVQMLPPNTTSHLQPQDAGVIQAFKARLEQLETRHIVDRFDAILERAPEIGKENMEREIDCLYHVDVLEAMQWAQEA